MVQLITNKNFKYVFQIYCLLVYCPRFSLIFDLNNLRNIQEESSLTDIFCIMVDSFSFPLNGFLKSGVIVNQNCTQLLDPALDDLFVLSEAM